MIRDPIDIKNSNVWQNAGKTNQIQISQSKRTLIIMGDEKCGKTSFIKIIKGDLDLEAKPTQLIDFNTIKKQGIQIEMYEISSPKFQKSLQFLIKPQNCSHLMILLCIDLTKPQHLVNKINQHIQSIRTLCKQIINKKKINHIQQYNEQRNKNYHFIQTNDDVQIIKRMPFRFSLIGCKYDLFEKMKIEQKKWVCRCLRYLAHINQANLLFSSTKNMQINAELRSLFVEQIFGIRNSVYSNKKDHNKALFILTGEDKISEMSLPAFNNSGAFNEIKILEQQLQSVFPSSKNIQIPINDIQKQFNSIGLDSLIDKYRKQIVSMMKEKNIKTKQNSQKNIKDKTITNLKFKETKYQFEKGQQMQNQFPIQKQQKFKQKSKQQQHFLDQQENNQSDEN